MSITTTATETTTREFAVKITMKQGDAWLNNSQNTHVAFYKGLEAANPKAEKNTFTVLNHKDTEFGDCSNGNISLYNQHNLVGFIGYRNADGDLLDVQEFLKNLKDVKVEDIHTRRASEVVSLFE